MRGSVSNDCDASNLLLSHGLGIGRAPVQHALSVYPTVTTDVNEQNGWAVGFYLHIGFKPIGRSPVDYRGRAYPLLHLRIDREIQRQPTAPDIEISK